MSDKEARRLEKKKTAAAVGPKSLNHNLTFEEKNFLRTNSLGNSANGAAKPKLEKTLLTTKKLTNLRRKSLGNMIKKNSLATTYDTLEQEIKQLQMRTQLDLPLMQQHHNQLLQEKKASIASINQIEFSEEANGAVVRGQIEPIVVKNHSLQSRLANIGRLDSNKSLINNRSSTPDESTAKTSISEQQVSFEKFQFKLEK